MFVFRIVKDKIRTEDLSGIGAAKVGGRWNHKGTIALYTSENSSLAMLESLVHFEPELAPPQLVIIKIEINDDKLLYEIPDADYPKDWLTRSDNACRDIGKEIFSQNKYVGIKVRSAVNPAEYNIILDPAFRHFANLVKIVSWELIDLDKRLL